MVEERWAERQRQRQRQRQKKQQQQAQTQAGAREGKGEFDIQFKDLNIHDAMAEVEVFDELFPVDRAWILNVVRGRANEANDKYRNNWHANHIDGFLICIFGGTQVRGPLDCRSHMESA